MTTAEIGILIWVVLLTLQVLQNMKRMDKMGWDMTRKMDKPPEPTELEKWTEARKDRPLLTQDELDKVATPEEKEIRRKLYGSEYGNPKK